jgi:putative oxidoreductase
MSTTSDIRTSRKSLVPCGYTFIRIALGLILMPHGFAKLFLHDAAPTSRHFVDWGWPYPLAWAYCIGALEFFGGLLLALGLFTRVVAVALVVEMAVISFAVLSPKWDWGHHGMEYTVLMGLVALGMALGGGGPYSLDRLFKLKI